MAFAHDHSGVGHTTPELSKSLKVLDQAAAHRYGRPIVPSIARAGGWRAPEEGTERFRMLDAALGCRGMHYRFRGAQGGHDAWSLVRGCATVACERDCIDIPRDVPGYAGVSEQAARVALTQWGLSEIKPRHAEPGDVLLFSVPDEPLTGGLGDVIPGGMHIGVLTAPGGAFPWALYPTKVRPAAMMVHAFWGRAVCEAYVTGIWESRVVSAWSFDTEAKSRPFKLEAA